MARRRTPSALTKPPPPFAYWHTTPEDTAALQILSAAFGQLTHISHDTYHARFSAPPWWGRRCAECDTRYVAAKYPWCGWCRVRDGGYASLDAR